MNIVLFEDNQCHHLRPLGLFRPLYDVYAGSWTLFKLLKRFDCPVQSLIRRHFLFEDDSLHLPDSPFDEPYLFLNASVEPDTGYLNKLSEIMKTADPFISTSGNRVAAAFVPPGKKLPAHIDSDNIAQALLEMNLPLELQFFKTIDRPHDVVESHLRLFESNLEMILSTGTYKEKKPEVYLGEGVELASSTSFDTTNGPVVIGNGVRVLPFTFFEGPVHVGEKTRIIEHSSIKDMTSIEYECKIGGEVETSVIEPHSNKQHHGFLGHSWIGRWVNLGAGTTTSDLKNTYGKVHVVYDRRAVSSGMQFLGSIVGDYAKTAVNTSLFTGKMVGVCSMIYGMVTTNVPSFSNYARSFGQITEINLDQSVTTQKRMFERRNIKQTKRDTELVKRVYELTSNERGISVEKIMF